MGCVVGGVLACGPDSTGTSGGGEGGGGAATDDATDADATDEGSNDGGASGNGASGGGDTTEGAGEVCSELLDATPPAEPTLVELTNGLSEPVFVGYASYCVFKPFELTRVSSGGVVVWHDNCADSCSQLLLDGECTDCDGCAFRYLRIDPGATHTIEWDGLVSQNVDIPSECLDEPCSNTCSKWDDLAAGQYRFTAVAATECPGDESWCSCDAGESSCTFLLEDAPEPVHMVSVEVDLPTSTVALTIE